MDGVQARVLQGTTATHKNIPEHIQTSRRSICIEASRRPKAPLKVEVEVPHHFTFSSLFVRILSKPSYSLSFFPPSHLC